jgi:hypothetical protein
VLGAAEVVAEGVDEGGADPLAGGGALEERPAEMALGGVSLALPGTARVRGSSASG